MNKKIAIVFLGCFLLTAPLQASIISSLSQSSAIRRGLRLVGAAGLVALSSERFLGAVRSFTWLAKRSSFGNFYWIPFRDGTINLSLAALLGISSYYLYKNKRLPLG